jgi:rhodanese-related sulfurtransferase
MSTTIDRLQLQDLLTRGAQLVEVLPAVDYAEAHLPGAINLPLKQLNRQTSAQLDRARPIIVYCNDFQ